MGLSSSGSKKDFRLVSCPIFKDEITHTLNEKGAWLMEEPTTQIPMRIPDSYHTFGLEPHCAPRTIQDHLFPELLSLIFTMAAGDAALKFPVDLTQVPWILGRVCSEWRAIARGVHALWNRISVDARNPKHESMLPSFLVATLPPDGPLYIEVSLGRNSKLICVVVPYLQRATKFHVVGPDHALQEVVNLPSLSLATIEDLAFIRSADHKTSHSLIMSIANPELFELATRLQHLRLDTGISRILSKPYIILAQLKHLDLSRLIMYNLEGVIEVLKQCTSLKSFSSPHSLVSETSRIIEDDFKVCLELSTLAVNCPAASAIPLPWNALKNLSVSIDIQSEQESEAVIDLLHKASQVETLVIDVPHFNVHLSYPSTVLLGNLYKLSIHGRDSRLLEHLELPRLHELEICQQLYVGIGNIRNFIKRSRCALQILEFRTRPRQAMRNLTFLDILRDASSLRELYAPGMLFDTPLLQDVADGTLLPNIVILTIGVGIPCDFGDMLEVKMRRGEMIRFAHGYCRTVEFSWRHLDDKLERISAGLSANLKLHYRD